VWLWLSAAQDDAAFFNYSQYLYKEITTKVTSLLVDGN